MPFDEMLENIRAEDYRTRYMLHLTANETLMSDTARSFLGLRLADRYFMGGGDEDQIVDFKPFTFRGLPDLQALVGEAQRAAQQMLHAASVNLNCLSGVHAMMCAILSTTHPGDMIMSVDLSQGGHFATKLIIERTGRRHIATSYDFDSLRFDAARIAEDFHAAGARALYLDVSFYLNPHNLLELRELIGDEAIIIFDASHTLGLIMGGIFQQPLLEGANVVCGNTHKTLPGPHKGMIAFRDDSLAVQANGIINSGLFSSAHTGSTIALAISILEMERYGHEFATQIVRNSNSLGTELAALGYEVRASNSGRYSENHQVHLMVGDQESYRQIYALLVRSGISVNFDNTLGGRMYLRLGTQDVTRRGMTEAQLVVVATLLDRALRGDLDSGEVAAFMRDYQTVRYSFDELASLPGASPLGSFVSLDSLAR
jgi:glycine/serine hydroxymethyltransferase